MSLKVVVANPVRQHSHQLAKALQRSGSLHGFFTLLPDRRALSWIPRQLDWMVPPPVFRHSLEDLPRDAVNVLIGPLYMQKLTSFSRFATARYLGELAAWTCFDRWVAKAVRSCRPDVVVGYEMCCAETFRVARHLGAKCILDAAACHYRWVDEILPDNISGKRTWPGRMLRARKDTEIERSDAVFCVSELARSTYRHAGIDEYRLLMNPLGCDHSLFSPTQGVERTGGARFIFVGQAAYHKGFDILLSAFGLLREDFPDAELLVAGAVNGEMDYRNHPGVRLLGMLSQKEIGSCLRSCDCLVLPSRCESFGMVVIEALASGIPVIVSDNAGASMVVDDGDNGWRVPAGNVGALLERMSHCCRNLDKVRGMTERCVASVAPYDWAAYTARAIEAVRRVCAT